MQPHTHYLGAVHDSNESKKPAAAETGEDGETQVALRFDAHAIQRHSGLSSHHL